MATGTISKYADGIDSGWKELQEASAFTGTIKYRKMGKIFQITNFSWIWIINGITKNGGSITLGTIPSGDRPDHVLVGMVYVNRSPYPLILLKIENGAIRIYNNTSEDIPADTGIMLNGMQLQD